MKNFSKKILSTAALCIFLFFPDHQASAQITSFFFEGDPGFVAGGYRETLSASDGYTITGSTNYQGGASFSINSNPSEPTYDLDFSASTGTQLGVGLYLNATRFPFNLSYYPTYSATNGLSFTGNGRGDNMLTGEFQVLEASYSDLGVVQTFAADFIQNDEGNIYNSDYGSIRYNSSIPIDVPATFPSSLPVPEPSTAYLFLAGVIVLGPRCRRIFPLR